MNSSLLDSIETVLVADVGRTATRGFVLEQIGGSFRFVARAEHPTSGGRTSNDWDAISDDLSWMTGRRVSAPLSANGDGADALLCVSTLAAPARVLVIEAGVNGCAAPILEMLQRAHASLMQLTTPSGRKDGGWLATSLAQVRSFAPEMVVFIGSGASDALQRANQLIKQIGPIEQLARAVVIADGPAQDQAAAAFEGVRVRKISPSARDGQDIAADLERELTEAYRLRVNAVGLSHPAIDNAETVIPRAHAVDIVNRFVATTFGRRVLSVAIDDGSHVHWASGDQGAMISLPELDLGTSITGFSDAEIREAASWLPFDMPVDDLVAWALNRSIRPHTITEQPRDKSIEQALARQIVRRGLAEIRKSRPSALSDIDLVIGSSQFGDWDQPGAAALTLLDSIDQLPNDGLIDLALDRDGLMVAAGALSTIDPNLAASVFEHDALLHLGSAIIIGGGTHEGDLACRGEVRYSTGEISQFSVASGAIEVLQLQAGETASLTLRPERNYSVGGRPAGETVQLTGDRQLIGGTVGIIVDARSRPLLSGGTGRAAKVKQWLDAVNGNRFSSTRRVP